jgi:hypothetical protein
VDVKIIGRIRKALEGIDTGSPGDDEQIALTGQLEQLVALGASPYGEITRLGRAYKVGTAAAVAAVVAIPTTAAMLQLYNNEPDGGRSLIIDWVAASGVAKTAAAGQAQILVCVGQVREAIPADAALAIVKMNGLGGGNGDTKARTVLTATALPAATGVAANWMPWGPGHRCSRRGRAPRATGSGRRSTAGSSSRPGASSRCMSWPTSSARRSRPSSAGTRSRSSSGSGWC